MNRYRSVTLLCGPCLALCLGCSSGYNRYSAVSVLTGKCLSLEVAGGYSDGDPVEQWNCAQYHLGLQKEWLFVPLASTSRYQVKSIHSGKCLEVKTSATSGTSNGDPVQQAKCTGAANQEWTVVTGAAGTTFTALNSGKCLQAKASSGGVAQDGDAVEQWTCAASAKNQLWKLQAASTLPPNPPLDTGPGELCTVCNPGNPGCKAGAMCIVTSFGQSLCGQACTPASGCPSGYSCTAIVKLGQTYYQCVPTGGQCPL